MLHVIATVELNPGTREAYLAALRDVTPAVRAEDGCIQYEASAPIVTEISTHKTIDPDTVVILEKWRDFAAFAWQKYLTVGRGAIVVNLRNASKSAAGFHVPTYYVAEGSQRLANRGGWPNEEISDVIKEYDPEQDVVLIFLRLDGDVFHYNVSDELTPPLAYKTKSGEDESHNTRLSSDDDPPTSN